MSHTLTRPFFVLSFWIIIFIVLVLILSPLVYYLVTRREKEATSRIIFGGIILFIDAALITVFLIHIHHAGTSLPALLHFYVEYFKTAPR
jgi:hypothetical protein